MKQLDIVSKTMQTKWFRSSFINCNNELILIPKFNVWIGLDDVSDDFDFKMKLVQGFSRDCSCALRYKSQKRLEQYYSDNIEAFNYICGTNFNKEDMLLIYTKLGNFINYRLANIFVSNGFDLRYLKEEDKR